MALEIETGNLTAWCFEQHPARNLNLLRLNIQPEKKWGKGYRGQEIWIFEKID